jgi:hypothetical protein
VHYKCGQFNMGLNPTTPTTPQLQPQPVPPLHLQSTLRGCAEGQPDLLSLLQQRRGALPMSTCSGRLLASRSSSTTSSNWRKSMSSTNTSTSTLRGTSARVCTRYRRLPPRCLPQQSMNWRISQTLTPIPTPFPSLASSIHGQGKPAAEQYR